MWFSYKEDHLHIKESVRTTSIFLSQKKESIDRSVVVSNRYTRTVNYVINCMSFKKNGICRATVKYESRIKCLMPAYPLLKHKSEVWTMMDFVHEK